MNPQNNNLNQLSPTQLQQLALLVQQTKVLTGIRYSLMDKRLFRKLELALRLSGARHLVKDLMALRNQVTTLKHTACSDQDESLKIEKFRNFNVRVKYYDQLAA